MEFPTLPLALAAVAGFADMLGGYLTVWKGRFTRNGLLYLTGLAAGFILAAAILDRIPETVKHNPHGAVFILVGFAAIYLIENLFSTHAHDLGSSHQHPAPSVGEAPAPPHDAEVWHTLAAQEIQEGHPVPPVEGHAHALVAPLPPGESLISLTATYAAFIGLLVHTFFDGVAIGAGFASSQHTGVVMFLAVIFHKLPEGFSMSSLMLAAARSRKAAFLSVLSLAVTTVGGALFASLFSRASDIASGVLLNLATGSFLYIGASDLIPATNMGRNRLTVFFVLLGIVLFYLSLRLLALVGFHALE